MIEAAASLSNAHGCVWHRHHRGGARALHVRLGRYAALEEHHAIATCSGALPTTHRTHHPVEEPRARNRSGGEPLECPRVRVASPPSRWSPRPARPPRAIYPIGVIESENVFAPNPHTAVHINQMNYLFRWSMSIFSHTHPNACTTWVS